MSEPARTPLTTRPPGWIEVAGFKALRAPARVDLRPLTLLAGANSSGKSSLMQPFLLLKQTMEAPFDPGPVLLDGPHVRFTELGQLFARGCTGAAVAAGAPPAPEGLAGAPYLLTGGATSHAASVRLDLHAAADGAVGPSLAPIGLSVGTDAGWVRVADGASWLDLVGRLYPPLEALGLAAHEGEVRVSVVARRGLPFALRRTAGPADASSSEAFAVPHALQTWLRTLLHVPGLRGQRERSFPIANVATDGDRIRVQGPFTDYVATVLLGWQGAADGRLAAVEADLARLGVARRLRAQRINAVAAQILVDRTPGAPADDDLVELADVGFGVSTALPVVVALRATAPGQMVYVEQPELHLHPRAQLAMGHLLADAASRGVFVLVETHSRMILRAVQTAVAAQGGLGASEVSLNWFARDPITGFAQVEPAALDESGAFGAWPVDFSEAEAEADDAWLDLVLRGAAP